MADSGAASSLKSALHAPVESVHNQAFNVGMAENNLTVAQIAESVVAAVPGSELNITGEAGNDPRSYRVSFAKITEALPEYRPQWTVLGGAVELADAYRRHGLTLEAFTRRFTRLARLSDRRDAGTLAADLRPVWEAALRSDGTARPKASRIDAAKVFRRSFMVWLAKLFGGRELRACASLWWLILRIGRGARKRRGGRLS